MKESNYNRGKRLRVFGGPNGSGKSTIFNLIQETFDIGVYVNPDLIEATLKNKGRLQCADHTISNEKALGFKQFKAHHPLSRNSSLK